jgi:hypothetical protein
LSKLKDHVQGCELMRGVRAHAREVRTPALVTAKKTKAGREDPFLTPVMESSPTKDSRPPAGSVGGQAAHTDDGPPLPNRPRGSARRAERQAVPNRGQPGAPGIYDVPATMSAQEAAMAADLSRASSLVDQSPAMPRRKEVRGEALGLPTPPNRAPPAPPLLSQPGPPSNNSLDRPNRQSTMQNYDRNSHPSPLASHNPQDDTYGRPESAKVRQLVNLGLGISPREAEGLLTRAGGDVNLAAEMKMSG